MKLEGAALLPPMRLACASEGSIIEATARAITAAVEEREERVRMDICPEGWQKQMDICTRG